MLGAGLGTAADGLEQSNLDFAAFTREFLDPSTDAGRRYLPELGKMLAQSGTPPRERPHQHRSADHLHGP